MPLLTSFSSQLKKALFCSSLGVFCSPLYGFYVDGEGHYALRGEIRTAPGMAKDSGQFRAIDQSFRLLGEVRAHDNSSFFMELRLFDKPRQAYLGDEVNPQLCEDADDPQCGKAYQNVREPAYKSYAPQITKAYARYAFDYCILEAGRRGRQWGMGLFLDAGKDPFATGSSVFDGVSCDINIQKSQTLGVSVGYDKLAETGAALGEHSGKMGATNPNDDIDQLFLAIEFDDRKANAGSGFTKQIGIYAAQVKSADLSKGGYNTDITFIDLYTSFYLQNFIFQNEVLLSVGKTADPHMTKLGGAVDDRGEVAVNKMNSLALAGRVEWTLASSGSYAGPLAYPQGDAKRHVLFFNYAYAPGDSNGYYSDKNLDSERPLSIRHRTSTAKAVAFHRNFKPALILFNGRAETDYLAVDGVFDPNRLMNAQVYSLGYRYEDLNFGNIEVAGIYALLNESVPGPVFDYYDARKDLSRPVGYYGNSLGMELDVKYWYRWRRDVDLGLAAAVLVPGDAWQVKEQEKPAQNYLGQVFMSFYF